MKPVKFPESNKTFTKPEGWTDEECRPLPVFQNDQQIISCWEVTDEDIEKMKKTKRIWLQIWANGQPPVWVSPDYPFIPSPENN